MKLGFLLAFLATFGVASAINAQSVTTQPSTRPSRVVVTTNLPTPTKIVAPSPTPTVEVQPEVQPEGPSDMPMAPSVDPSNLPRVSLSFGEIKSKIAEAKRQLQTKPQLISSEDPKLQTNWVRIAFMDPRTSKIGFVTLTKDTYLKTGAVNTGVSTDGKMITVRTIRANGVNTPIQVVNSDGIAQLSNLAKGEYEVHVWHPQLRPGATVDLQRLTISDTTELKDLTFTVSLLPDPRLPLDRERAGY